MCVCTCVCTRSRRTVGCYLEGETSRSRINNDRDEHCLWLLLYSWVVTWKQRSYGRFNSRVRTMFARGLQLIIKKTVMVKSLIIWFIQERQSHCGCYHVTSDIHRSVYLVKQSKNRKSTGEWWDFFGLSDWLIRKQLVSGDIQSPEHGEENKIHSSSSRIGRLNLQSPQTSTCHGYT